MMHGRFGWEKITARGGVNGANGALK